MRLLLTILLAPFVLCGMLVFGIDSLGRRLGPLKWVVRIALIPLFIVSLPALLLTSRDDHGAPDGRERPFPSVDLCFEAGPWKSKGLLGSRFVLDTGGELELLRPMNVSELDPMMRSALEGGFPLEAGVRWGGVRVHTFVPGMAPMIAQYVAECDGRCLPMRFRGTPEEEKLADALFGTMRKASTYRAPTELEAPGEKLAVD